MKYFRIIFITFTAVAPESHTFPNVEYSQTGGLSPGGSEPAKIRGSTHPWKLLYNHRSRKSDDHDDVAHVSRYKPHRDFHARPIHFIRRTGSEPGTRIVEIERRPISQYFYRIFIKDSPNFHLNHIIQSGGPTPCERSLFRVPQRERVSDWMYEFSSTSDKHQGNVGGESVVKGEGAANGSTYTKPILLESSPGILTAQSTSVPKAEATEPRTDGKPGNNQINTSEYSLLTGTTQKGNEKKTDRFEYNTDETSRTEPTETGVNIQTTSNPPPRFFIKPNVIPTNVYKDLSVLGAVQSSNKSETLYTPRNKEVPRIEDASSRNETSHIMKLPKANQNQAVSENDHDSLKRRIGSWDSTKPTYPGRDSVKTHLPEPETNFQTSKTDPYFQVEGFNNRTNPTPDQKDILRVYGNPALVISDEGTPTFLKSPTRIPSESTPTLPARPHNTSKTYPADDFLKWKKGYAYPAYGKHSSGEVIRRKMILDMKSGLLKNTKFLAGNGYSQTDEESDAPAKRHYPRENTVKGILPRDRRRSPGKRLTLGTHTVSRYVLFAGKTHPTRLAHRLYQFRRCYP